MTKWKTPSFWWKTPEFAPAYLKPLGMIYGHITALRHQLIEQKDTFLPVVCVGNFVAGGAGKTPTTITICAILRGLGFKPVILSRGYSGRLKGPVRIDPTRHSAVDVGDEALMLAAHAPTVIAANRIKGAEYAISFGNVIVMDDGLQNPGIYKNLAIAVVDGAVGDGNGLCVPAGPLRAPLAAQMKWVDAIVIIDNGPRTDPLHDLAWEHDVPLFTAHSAPSPSYKATRGQHVLLYTGLGRPDKVRHMLIRHGAIVDEMVTFPDHHIFTNAEAENLQQFATAKNLKLVTTAKDHVRLLGFDDARKTLAHTSIVLDVGVNIDNTSGFTKLLGDSLGLAKN